MLAGDIDLVSSEENHGHSNGVVTDVLLCKSVTGSRHGADRSTRQHNYRRQSSQDQVGSSSTPGICSPCTAPNTTMQMTSNGVVVKADSQGSTLSEKELERRQKLRERKRLQRQNQDFAERERLRARGRIKALREDPVFRQTERQRDRERRRKARLLNQSQRVQEKDRDKQRKSLLRSLVNQKKLDLLQEDFSGQDLNSKS